MMDPITFDILWQRLISIMDEIDQIIVRTTFSTILSESRDFACILTDVQGRSLCQSVWSTANFSVVLPRTAKSMLDYFGTRSLCQGDVLATNDPWIGTGHLPDFILLTPIFWHGQIIAFIGTIAHVSDVGGHPGEIEGLDVFSEGLNMPPFKLYEAGVENELAFRIIGHNCRVPDMLLGDLRAMAGAARIGAIRIREFLDEYELRNLETLATEILDRSEALMRQKITALPDGVYSYGMDIDGYIDTVHLHATVTISGSDIYVDYAGSSPQTQLGSINCVYNSTFAASLFPFKAALVPDLPNNEGLFRPIHVSAPDGSILNATFPMPVKARAKTVNNVNQVLFGALWPVFGPRVNASNGAIWPFVLKGEDDQLGYFLVDMLPHGGRGATPAMDGTIPVAYPENSIITPCEILETRAPILFMRKEFRQDSAGLGQHRGGVGQIIVFKHIGTQPMIFNLTPDRITTAPPGIAGGQAGLIGEVRIDGELVLRFPPILLQPGSVVELHIAGGGGFGPVAEREIDRILEDMAMGLISERCAREDYMLNQRQSRGLAVAAV